MFRLFAASLLSSSLITGCATVEEDFSDAVDTTMAPLLGDATDAIADEYIVVFKKDVGAKNLRAAMNRVTLRNAKSRIQSEYTIIPAFAARLGQDDLAALRKNPDVAYVERNGIMTVAKNENVQADGIDRIDQRDLPRNGQYDDRGFDGTGVRVYIVDTGVRGTHTEFTGRVGGKADFVNDGRNGEDCNGHGSHVASTTAGTQFGVADKATIHGVRVLNCQGSGTFDGVIQGINFVAQQCATGAPCAANMSLGGGFSQAVNDAVTNAVVSGVPFAVAAGNENTNACTRSPASAPAAVTVGATEDNDAIASFSNDGPCVDIFAPGVTILGANITNDTATQSISGTSMASPHVAGAIAQMLGCKGKLTPAQVEANLDGRAIAGAISNEQGAQDLTLCSDWNDADGNQCSCGGTPPPPPPPPQGECQTANTCGGQAPSGCFCDSACTTFGDCCPLGPC
jgi:aqualysin 1